MPNGKKNDDVKEKNANERLVTFFSISFHTASVRSGHVFLTIPSSSSLPIRDAERRKEN